MDSKNKKSRTDILVVEGMTCALCRNRIEKKLRKTKGVLSADVDYGKGTAEVVYDDRIELDEIISVVQSLDYRARPICQKTDRRAERNNFVGALLLIFAFYMFLRGYGGGLSGGLSGVFPQAETGMGYWALFTVGLLTSLHCVAMCGGINLSQSISSRGLKFPREESPVSLTYLRPVAFYNLGRIASYTLIGGIVGALGSAVSFSGAMRGTVQIVAGIFMTFLGLNMLGMFGFLRVFAPSPPKFLTDRLENVKRGGPLLVGLFNGLMPCGPLQAMQIYALSSGSPAKGALSMFFFGLGTLPLMFGLGTFGSLMSGKFAGRVAKAGAVLVIAMGVVMFNNGTTISGLDIRVGASQESERNAAEGGEQGGTGQETFADGFQEITTPLTRRGYPALTVKVGIPVRWNLRAGKGTLNGCNNSIVIPEYNIEKRLQTGDNMIEFTPVRTGRFRYSCWMGMVRGTITVVDEDTAGQSMPRGG